jgi:hypothetical protein
MFVLVLDTSLMNVSIAAVIKDLRHDGERRPGRDRARGPAFTDLTNAKPAIPPSHGLRRSSVFGLTVLLLGDQLPGPAWARVRASRAARRRPP